MVLDSITSTPRWIRQPKQRDVHDVLVFVCKCVLGSPRASQPLNILAFLMPFLALGLMPLRLAVGATPIFPGASAPPIPVTMCVVYWYSIQ